MDRTTLMSISFGPLYDVMSSQSSGMCCLPVCGHHFLPAQEIVIRLCEAYVQKHTRHRGAAVLVFPLGIKGICLAWRFNHAPSHRRIWWCSEDISALCGIMGLMYSVQCRWERFILETRCNPAPPPLARSQQVHVLRIRVVFYNISGKFWWLEFRGSLSGLQAQSFISKDAVFTPQHFCCSSGKVPRFMSRFIVFTPGRGGGDVLIAPGLFYYWSLLLFWPCIYF